MNRKIINILFFLIVFSIPFNVIPKIVQLNFIGSGLGKQLLLYPFIIGVIYTLYWQYKTKDIFIYWKKFSIYMLLIVTVSLISIILGVIDYPYYSFVKEGPINQIEKLPILIALLEKIHLSIDVEYITVLWQVVRSIKGMLLSYFYTFGLSYLIFCWYHNHWKTAIRITILASICSFIPVIIYGFVELFHMLKYKEATDILITINPLLHDIRSNDTWWPPLLWEKAQFRSVLAEPSYLGIYGAFILPIIWCATFISTKLLSKFFLLSAIFLLSTLLFLAQARTASILLLGELILLVVLSIYLRNKDSLIKGVSMILITALSFYSSNIIIMKIQELEKVQILSNTVIENNTDLIEDNTTNIKNIDSNVNMESSVKGYINDNVLSVVGNKRSNNARFGIMLADINIGIEHPIFGVGDGLRNAYIPDYIPQSSINNYEIKMWINNMKEKGILKSGFPQLGEYSSRFSQNGVVGIIIFLVPAFILLFRLIKKSYLGNKNERIVYGTIIIVLLAMMTSGIGESLNTVMGYWIILGIGYSVVLKDEKSKIQ